MKKPIKLKPAKSSPKEFKPTTAERRAILSLNAQIAQLQAEGGELMREIRARLGLGQDVEIGYDQARELVVIVERPAPPAEPPKA